MDIRNILNTLDDISEGIFDNENTALKNQQAQADFAVWKEQRYQQQKKWLDDIRARIGKYEELKHKLNLDKPAVKESISKELVESFGYQYDESILNKAIPGLGAVLGAKEAYDRWMAGDRSGAVISTLSTLGWLVPGPMGWVLGGGIDALDALRDSPSKPSNDTKPSAETTPTTNVASTQTTTNRTDNPAMQLQTELQQAGYNIGPTGVDGKLGKNTVAAIQSYKKDHNLSSDLDAIAQLTGASLNESIDYNQLSDIDKMAYLIEMLSESKIKTGKDMISAMTKWQKGGNPAFNGAVKTSSNIGKAAASVASGIGSAAGWTLKKAMQHPFISAILAGLGKYHFMVGDDGNIVSQQSEPQPQAALPSRPDTKPTQPSSDSTLNQPIDQSADISELKGLASDIEVYMKNAAVDADPSLAKELEELKNIWAQTKSVV